MQTTEINRPTLNGVAGIAALRALAPGQYQRVSVDGHSLANDGGGGIFVWNASSGSADNGGTIIKPTGLSGNGRWIRMISDAVDVRWFGAKGDGVTDDTAAIQAAHDFATPLQRPVYLPNTGSAYVISDHILVDSNAVLLGDPYTPGASQPGSTLYLASGNNVTMLRNRNILAGTNQTTGAGSTTTNITLSNLIFDGNYSGNPGSTHYTGATEILSDKANPWQGCGGQIGFYGVSGLLLDTITIRNGQGFGCQLSFVSNCRIPFMYFDAHKRDGLHINCGCTSINIGTVTGITGDDMVALNQWDWRNSCPTTTATSGTNITGFIQDIQIDKILPVNCAWSPLKITTGDGGSVNRVTVGLIEGQATYSGNYWGYVADAEVPGHTSGSKGFIYNLTIGEIHIGTSGTSTYGHVIDINCQINALRIGQLLCDQYHYSPYESILIESGATVQRLQIDSFITTSDAVNNQTDNIHIAGTVGDLILSGLDITGPGGYSGANAAPLIKIESGGTLSRLHCSSPHMTLHAGLIQQLAGAGACDVEINGGSFDNFTKVIHCQGTMMARINGSRFTNNQGAAIVLDNSASALTLKNSDCDWTAAGGTAFSRTSGTLALAGSSLTPNLSPGMPGGMVFWFKADAGVYHDLGSTLATSGQSVEQWSDQSGNANHATQSTSGSRPTYYNTADPNMVNGLPAIGFGGGTYMTLSAAAVCAEYYCVFYVNGTTFPDYGAVVEVNPDGARMGTFHAGLTYFNSSNPPSLVRKDGVNLNPNELFDLGTVSRPMLMMVRTNSPSTSRGMVLGALATSNWLNGVICEVVGFSANLSVADRNFVELSLQTKWGTPKLGGQ